MTDRLPLARDQAYAMVLEKIGQNNLLKHILAVEAAMRGLAEHFDEDVNYWGLTGLLHDLDYNQTKDDEAQHTYITREWLKDYELPEKMLHAIEAHPGHVPCENRLDHALYAVDPTTGFVVACALMHPDKKLDSLTEEFMLRRFAEKRFAAGATRENIAQCEKLHLELGEFLMMVRASMMTITKELGL